MLARTGLRLSCLFIFVRVTDFRMCVTAAITATQISSACPKCGVIKRSGKLSCCARAGSWFKNCGGDADPKFSHSWTEGVRVCRGRQSQAVWGQQLHVFQPSNVSSYDVDVGKGMDSKTVIASGQTFASTSVNTYVTLSVNMSTTVPIIASTHISSYTSGPNSDLSQPLASVSIGSRECTKLYVVIFISMILVVVQQNN